MKRETPRVTRRTHAYKGTYIDVRVDELDLGDGRLALREIIEHPGAVVIAALDDDGQLVLVRQYRHAVEEDLLELPAGVLEDGEEPSAAASRELREEAGIEAKRWDYLGCFFSSPGFLHENLHAFLARDLVRVPSSPDDDEDIELEWHALDGLLREPGTVCDAKTLAALLLVSARLRREGEATSCPFSEKKV